MARQAILEKEGRRKMPRGRPFQKGHSGNPKGKKPGTPSKRVDLKDKRLRAIAESGLTPLEFLISVVRDVTRHVEYRIEAARAAAPYCHRKMPIAIEGGDPNKPIIFEASALSSLDAAEKVMLLGLVEKMASTMQALAPPPRQKPAFLEGIAKRQAEQEDHQEGDTNADAG